MNSNPLQFRPELTRRNALKGLTLGAGATLLGPFSWRNSRRTPPRRQRDAEQRPAPELHHAERPQVEGRRQGGQQRA